MLKPPQSATSAHQMRCMGRYIKRACFGGGEVEVYYVLSSMSEREREAAWANRELLIETGMTLE
jgi:hypothetical protein